MQKVEYLKKLEEAKVVAVVRTSKLEELEQVIEGGIKAIELTYSIPNVNELIEKLSSRDDIIVGAGSVIDVVSARLAILSGSKFIVGPTFNKEIAKLCNLYQIPYIPGCMSLNEMQEAMSYGVDVVKLFPASNFDSSIIKAFKAPMPQINIMPTGGISLSNMEEWFKAGAILVGTGGSLFKGNIKENAKEYMEEVKRIENEKN